MKALCFKLLLLITLLVLNSGDIFAQVPWTKYPGNPVMSGSGNGMWDKHIFGPSVLFNADSNRYEMWYNGSYGPAPSWDPYQIGFAWSADGINWTKYAGNPVLTPDPGTWDAVSMLFPCVIHENGQYKMWYAGFNNNGGQIGYATSPNGINWTKYGGNPVFTAGNAAWEAGSVLVNAVLYKLGQYTMYYTGGAEIGRATSLDGINWQRDTINNPVLSGTLGQWDEGGVSLSRCLYADNLIHMWYTGFNNNERQIGYATSLDGITWIKYGGNPILTKGSSGSWDGSYVQAGTVLLEGNTFRMWYDGSREPTPTNLWRIGVATAPLVPVPVELTSFTVTSNGKEVILKWSTVTELNNQGFEIQRSTEGIEFFTVGFVNGHGTTTEQQNYSYADRDLDNGKYFYRLKQVDYNGSYEYSDVVEIDFRTFNSYLLEQCYPNPFNPTTTIGFGIQDKSNVKITILNAIGEEVAVVLNEEREPGFHQVEFNAANLPSGVYFYQLKAGSFVETKKMILMK
jgi:predicted GH43/DUF377 family glycosyl hydrolase